MILRGIVLGVVLVFLGQSELLAQTPPSKNHSSHPSPKRRRNASKHPTKKRKRRPNLRKHPKRAATSYPLELLRSRQRVHIPPTSLRKPLPTSPAQVMRSMRKRSLAARWCYERAWKRGSMPPARQLFPVSLEISADGRVVSLRIGHQKTTSPTIKKLEACLFRTFRYERFQTGGHPMTIQFPML